MIINLIKNEIKNTPPFFQGAFGNQETGSFVKIIIPIIVDSLFQGNDTRTLTIIAQASKLIKHISGIPFNSKKNYRSCHSRGIGNP